MNEYSKYTLLKSSMENVLGTEAWYALKESNHLPTWKKYSEKLLKTILFSIEDTVEIFDDNWLNDIKDSFEHGFEFLKLADSIDEVISVIAGTLIEVSFYQIGHMPRLKGNRKKIKLRKGSWQLHTFRTVVYLQTKEQKENYFLDSQRRKIGFDAQQDLLGKYYRSKSELTFSDWCKQKN